MGAAPIIGFRGLRTSGNPLTRGPGALLKAVNCVLTEADELMPRRGQDILADVNFGPGSADNKGFAMEQWGTAVLVHHGPNTAIEGNVVAIGSDPENTSLTTVGSHLARSPQSMRMKFAELAKSQYFTTSTGVFGLTSPTATERAAGVQRPGDFLFYSLGTPSGSRLTGNPASGWLAINAAVGYRAVIGRKDSNDVVKLSAPCGRLVIANPGNIASASLERTGGNTVTATVASTRGYRVGDVVYISSAGSADFLAGVAHPYTLTAVTAITLVWTNIGTGVNTTLAAQALSSGTKNCQLWVNILPGAVDIGVVAGDFVQLYRTIESATATTDPGDEEFQCYERTVTAADISNGYVEIIDTTPDSFLGAPLYTNANTGTPGGLDFEHLPPPLMTDMAVFDGKLWGTQTVDVQTLPIRLLGVGSPDGLQSGDKLAIGVCYYVAGTDFILVSDQLPSQNILGTVQSFVTYFVSDIDASPLRVRNGYNGAAPTGLIQAESVSPTAATFYAATSRPSAFQEALPAIVAVTSVVRAANVITVTTAAPHGFATHDDVVLAMARSSPEDANFLPRLVDDITVTGASTFTFPSIGPNGAGSSTYGVYPTTAGSTQVKKQLRFSEHGEPEAWPLVNFPSGLPDGAVASRIKALNGSLYVLLEHGDIYTVSGQYPYSVQKVDGTAAIVCPDTLVEFTGRLFFLSTQGVVSLGPGGIRRPPASIDVDQAVRERITRMREGGTTAVAFAVAYESDHQYQLWLPAEDAAVSDPGSWKAVDTFVFQENVNGWTTWDVDSHLSAAGRSSGGRNHGLVYKPLDLEMMVGQLNFLIEESKTWTWEDAADGLVPIQVATFTAGTLGTVCNGVATDFDELNAGDVIQFPDLSFGTVIGDPTGLDHVDTDGQYASDDPALVVAWRAIAPLTAQWVAATVGTPGMEKHWRDWQLHLGLSGIRVAQCNFSTERTGEASATRVSVQMVPGTWVPGSTFLDQLSNERVAVPEDCQRGSMLVAEIDFVDRNVPPAPQAFTQFKLLGMTPTGEDISGRTPR